MEGVEFLDALLVPSGLLFLILYHCQLAYRIHTFPTTTVIGINQMNRRIWIQAMMQDGLKNGVLAVQTLRNNIMASTLLATATITLCSVIAVLVSSGHEGRIQEMSLVLGDRRVVTSSIKLLCVLVCFLVAFLCNVQSVRYYSQLSFLVSIPIDSCAPGLSLEYVNKAIMKGGQFWSIGLRALYFSLPLFLWLFGPIPMFVCSTILTILLHYLDTSNECNQTSGINPRGDINQML